MDTAMIAIVLGFSLRLLIPIAVLLGVGTLLRRTVRG